MYNIDKIKSNINMLLELVDLEVEESAYDYFIERAISKGCSLRNCSKQELETERKDYNLVLSHMAYTCILNKDKIGRIQITENGISNIFESGSEYTKDDMKEFVPLFRGIK